MGIADVREAFRQEAAQIVQEALRSPLVVASGLDAAHLRARGEVFEQTDSTAQLDGYERGLRAAARPR
ncbi:MAG: hypothetical protein IT378_17345 [Sandaracinaceae bacterium]|nr:hypothetical protein [Sandaracinaceae bacterium]